MTQIFPIPLPLQCPDCGTELSPALLSCPRCRRLVHGARLSQLAAVATQATDAGDVAAALGAWREALELLPPDSKQFATVSATISALTREADARGLRPTPPPAASAPGGRTAAKSLGVGGTLLFLLTQAKLLLFGLTKASTFFSMLLSIGVYWAAFGWKFAVGLVLSIYVHEMGHVWMLTRYGMKATAPMFVPGLGAMIRLRQHPADPREDAMIGLAGPMWGLAAALTCAAVWAVSRWPAWAAVASVGAWVNLFNLLPVWQLDGGRGFRALSRNQRWAVVAAAAVLLALTHEGLLVLILGAGAVRIFSDKQATPERGEASILYQFLFLLVTLALLAKIPVPVGAL